MGIYEVKEKGLAQTSKASILQRFPARRKAPAGSHEGRGPNFISESTLRRVIAIDDYLNQ